MGRLAFTKKTEPVDWFEIESRGRVFFTPKSEPAFDWSEIESRLQEISTPARPPDVLVERWVTSANDQAEITDRPVTNRSHPSVFCSRRAKASFRCRFIKTSLQKLQAAIAARSIDRNNDAVVHARIVQTEFWSIYNG
ncbi:hypothetical protein [Bradyrhizobium sp. AUGA SZCCT0042]|uniref:hypothetical protein n=1 Tax=Bradyrhizobium sp. AUGA SZCCT0042 TaxID=2807651 RepID=UPI001BAC3913|nr:hypothetical protein [Bradyrhizobium sp. AUGA SZCCT0042]MBR1298601.1 hypothetical protein [Bradyrhizobium sp. AUGA SZCCT0042]